MNTNPSESFRILSLDGGGAKGFYTLGVLAHLEAMLGGKPLSDSFHLIFGTSTGAIIASQLALGKQVAEIHDLYKENVPKLMALRGSADRSVALERLALKVFKDLDFAAFKTGVGIVTAKWGDEQPMIFKSKAGQSHGGRESFVPGFGCKIADAVVASCSAYPMFNRKVVKINDGTQFDLLDGGYCANNPTLFAIADAVAAEARKHETLRVVSIGVGSYPEPPKYWHNWVLSKFFLVRLLYKTLAINTNSMENLVGMLFKDVPIVRVNETYNTPEMATDLMEHDINKLNLLYNKGGDSFRKHERDLRNLFD